LIDEITDHIQYTSKPNVLIGIDGAPGGAGKTTLISHLKNSLSNRLNSNILSIETDDFLVPRSEWEYLSEDFFKDINNLYKLCDFETMSKVLHTFYTSRNTTIQISDLYSKVTGQKDKKETFTFKDKNIILVGGSYLIYPKFPQFDLKIFLSVKREKRYRNAMQRAQERHRSSESQDRGFNNFENFYIPYFHGKLSLFDIIIDNNDFDNPFIIHDPKDEDILN
jgi:uridine kinase